MDTPEPAESSGRGGIFTGAVNAVGGAASAVVGAAGAAGGAVVGAAGAAGGAAYGAASAVAGAAGTAGGAVFDAAATVVGKTEGVVGDIADVAGAAVSDVKDAGSRAVRALALDKRVYKRSKSTIGRKFVNLTDPVVVSQGADFGDMDPSETPVVLRMEICSSGEVKSMQWMAFILTTFAVLATVSGCGLRPVVFLCFVCAIVCVQRS